MHFHLPKPLHGWREFAGEVGIIVVGVLVALAAEQVVEAWNWARNADASESAIRQELAVDAGVFDERAIMGQCLEAKLHQVMDILQGARRTGTLPNIEYINGPATRPMVTAAWNAATADGTVSHLPQDFRKMLGVEYPMIDEYAHSLDNENQLWSVLRLADKTPGPISETLLAEISTAAAQLQFETAINDVLAQQALGLVENAGVSPNYSFPLDERATRAELLRQRPCKPLLVDGRPLLPVASAAAQSAVKG